MSHVYDILQRLHEYQDEIEAALEPAQRDDFKKSYLKLGKSAEDSTGLEEDEAALTTAVSELLERYPAVKAILQERDPGLLPAPSPAAAAKTPAVVGSTGAPPDPTPPAQKPPQRPPQGPTGTLPSPKPAPRWTPELDIQLFKEVVTAVIGVIIIAFTAYLALKSTGVAGDAEKSKDVQNVLSLMIGLAGVVLGYYFGRVPAEAQATQARKEATAAAAGAEAVGIKGEALAAEVDRVLGAQVPTRGGPQAPDMENMRHARDELRSSLHALQRR
jgi:hypothetical protein